MKSFWDKKAIYLMTETVVIGNLSCGNIETTWKKWSETERLSKNFHALANNVTHIRVRNAGPADISGSFAIFPLNLPL